MLIYVDMDDVLCDYTTSIESIQLKNPDILFPQSLPGFFRELTPIEGAVEAVKTLRLKKNIDLYILTAPSTMNPLSYTEKRLWIEDKFDYELTKNLIICSNKGQLKGDMLIDDHINGRGQENFEGQLVHFGKGKFPNWGAVLNEILHK